MNTLQKYTPFFLSALLMGVVLFVIYPHYQYYIDPDGTAYLTISQRYAKGDYLTAINGYWSPWSCWLTALLIKSGLQAIPASVVINAIGAAGFLYVSQSFFLKFNIIRRMQWLLNITLALFLCYAIFWQSFDDLWECFFLLGTLRIILVEGYKNKPLLWVLCGIVGALAYFAKAYSFPFFILNTICCVYFICKDNKAQWLKMSVVSVGTMILCSLPWIIALHAKYGIWTTSTAGSLNMSWYLVGHPEWKEGIGALLPPAYPGSPYYWEDPYLVNGATPHFWDSLQLMERQILRVAYNLYKYANSMNELSVFFAGVWLIAVGIVFFKKVRAYFPPEIFIAALSFLLFPIGYFLINFEGRYIWYMLPVSMIVGAISLQRISARVNKAWLSVLFYGLFAGSYLFYPVKRLAGMRDEGRDEFKIAKCLNDHNIKGAFTAEADGADRQRAARIAYFSGNPYFSIPRLYLSEDTLIQEMNRYHVRYCFFYPYDSWKGDAVTIVDDPHLHSSDGIQIVEFKNDSISGLKVFAINPR